MFGCKNYVGKKEGLRFFRFPLGDKERCAKWTAAVRREAWQPKKTREFATSILSQVGLQGLTNFSGFTRYGLMPHNKSQTNSDKLVYKMCHFHYRGASLQHHSSRLCTKCVSIRLWKSG